MNGIGEPFGMIWSIARGHAAARPDATLAPMRAVGLSGCQTEQPVGIAVRNLGAVGRRMAAGSILLTIAGTV